MRWLPAAGPAPEIDSSKFSYEISLLFPESRRESVLGGLVYTATGKTALRFPTSGLQCCRRGSRQKGQAARPCLLLRGLFSSGRQTELRQSPEPRNVFTWRTRPIKFGTSPVPKHPDQIRLTPIKSSIGVDYGFGRVAGRVVSNSFSIADTARRCIVYFSPQSHRDTEKITK